MQKILIIEDDEKLREELETFLNRIGIPFGLQFFKIAKLSLAPFGAKVV
mgnify:FL=1